MLGCLLLAASVSLAALSSSEPVTTQPKTTHPKPSGARKTGRRATRHRSVRHRIEGQRAIDGERVRQIQQALLREHYLNGEASGTWDGATEQAMRRYQADHGWQTKTVPDSRALIRLGLGPDNGHLLNPESAMTTQPSGQNTNSPGGQKAAGTPDPRPAAAAPMPAGSAPDPSPPPPATSHVPVH